VLRPATWPLIVNPFKPSWGEPFVQVAKRMIAAVDDAWDAADGGEVVMVSHQLPIVMVQRAMAGKHLWHDPRQRRCTLSSITTFVRLDDAEPGEVRYREVDYREPAAALLATAIDTGAV
jgi:broad specificity phosphatase PhoE